MQTTANYGLKKPEGTDVVDVQNFNDNADIVDTQLKKINDNAGALTSLQTTAKSTLVAAINEVFQSGTNVKSGTISAVNNKGGSLSASATWDQIISAINAIARGQGNAVESQVLSGVKFSNSDGQLRTGSMPNNGAVTMTPSGSAQTIPAGYHNGSGKVNAVAVPVANVLSGITIAGQAGTMPNKGAVTIIPGTADQAIPAGYHNGQGKVKGDSNLVAPNILEGKSIFNVVGTLKQFAFGMTDIVDSSHSKTNAPVDLASIRLEFYSRVFPNNLNSIQVLKNSSTNVYSSAVINTDPTGNATDEESVYITINETMYPDTDYKVVLPKGCMKDKLENNFNAMEYNFHTNPNPSVWVNNSNGLLTARSYLAGCGSQDAGLAFGGTNSNLYTCLKATEKFNGVVWINSADMNIGLNKLCASGSQNSAMSFGGYSSGTDYDQQFNGTSWATLSTNINKNGGAGCGNEWNSTLFFGEGVTTLSYNGVTWATANNLITKRYANAGCGTQNAALAIAGQLTNVSTLQNTVEKFNGVTWASTGATLDVRDSLSACGTQDLALAFGGRSTSVTYEQDLTQKFNGSIWSITNSLNVGRTYLAACGSQNMGLAFGGINSSNISISTTEKFFG